MGNMRCLLKAISDCSESCRAILAEYFLFTPVKERDMARTCSIFNVRVDILLWYQRAETIASLQVPGANNTYQGMHAPELGSQSHSTCDSVRKPKGVDCVYLGRSATNQRVCDRDICCIKNERSMQALPAPVEAHLPPSFPASLCGDFSMLPTTYVAR